MISVYNLALIWNSILKKKKDENIVELLNNKGQAL